MPDTPNTAEPGKPRRRWFQFGLRTMLVGVVLVGAACSYVAREWPIVAARKNWLKEHPRFFAPYYELQPAEPNTTLPFIRRLLGDKPQAYVYIESPAEEKTAQELFPEAAVYVFTSAD